MNKYIFIKNFGKYQKKQETIWADNLDEAWALLEQRVSDTTDWLVVNASKPQENDNASDNK